MKLDWGHSYEQTARGIETQLLAARAKGETFFRPGDSGVPVNPSKMTHRQIGELARRHAERVVQYAINQHNEQISQGR